MIPEAQTELVIRLEFLLSHLCSLLRFCGFLFYGIQVFENELCLNHFDIAFGIDAAVDVYNVLIVKTADNMCNCVDVPYVGKKLIAKSFSLACSFDKAGDVYKFYGGRNNFRR